MNKPANDDTQTLVFRKPMESPAGAGPVPEDLRLWQPAVALAHRVRAALDQPREGKVTSAAAALPAVVLWCLATGRYGSTDISALCDEEPMGRHLSGGFSFSWSDVQRYRRELRVEVAARLTRLLELSWPGAAAGSRPDFAAEAERRLNLAVEVDHLAVES